jgi:hypothetical protein
MEMLVIGVIAIVAFAAVLIPLFRRRPGVGDAREFEGVPGPSGGSASSAANAAPADAAASADTPANEVTPSTPTSDALADRARRIAGADDAQEPAAAPDAAVDELELEVMRYRTAVRAGTVCRKCGQANPAESMFCFDCGERLPRDEAKEFE